MRTKRDGKPVPYNDNAENNISHRRKAEKVTHKARQKKSKASTPSEFLAKRQAKNRKTTPTEVKQYKPIVQTKQQKKRKRRTNTQTKQTQKKCQKRVDKLSRKAYNNKADSRGGTKE